MSKSKGFFRKKSVLIPMIVFAAVSILSLAWAISVEIAIWLFPSEYGSGQSTTKWVSFLLMVALLLYGMYFLWSLAEDAKREQIYLEKMRAQMTPAQWEIFKLEYENNKLLRQSANNRGYTQGFSVEL